MKIFVCMLAAALIVASCGGKEPAPVATATPAPTAAATLTPKPVTPSPSAPASPGIDAASLYAGNCASCHGANRQGGFGPALTPQSLATRSDGAVRDTILNGRAARNMPAWRGVLSNDEVDALVEFLKSTSP